jgi:hypothetical protein
MTIDKTLNLSINVVYKIHKAYHPLPNITEIKQHTCSLALLYERRLFKFLKPELCPQSSIQTAQKKNTKL